MSPPRGFVASTVRYVPEPIGSEIARRHPERFEAVAAADRLLIDRTPCEVCGHPTGDCDARDHVVAERRREAEKNLAGVSTAPSPQVQAMLDGWVIVTERVTDERPAPGGGPPLTIVKYAPGKRIAATVAAAEGIPCRPATVADFEANRSI